MSKPNSQTNQKMTNDKFWQFRNLAGDDQKAELLPYIGEENFHKMMVENPKRIFAWKYND